MKNRHTSATWMIVLLLTGTVAVRAQQRHSTTLPAADQHELARAVSLYEQGRIEDAEPSLKKILDRYPNNEAANETLALIYAQRGSIDLALPFFQRAADAPSSSATDHANLGAAFLKLGRATEALPELKLAARLDPRNAETVSALGQAYMLTHDPVDGAKAFAAAARVTPTEPDLLYNWALALSETGKLQDAADILGRLPESKRSPETDAFAGDLDEQLGHYIDAVKHYHDAASKDPSESNLYALAAEFLHHWSWNEARKIAEFGLAKYPASSRLRLALGIANYGAGQYPKAAEIFSQMVNQDPDNSSYADLLGRSCGNINESQDGPCSQLIAFAELHPHNAAAALYAAENILHQPGAPNLPRARALLTNAIAADPKLPDAYYQMGVLDQEQLQWQASVEPLEKAVSLRPEFASAHYRLARAYSRLKEPEKAATELALQKKYSQQENELTDKNLKNVSIFLPSTH